MSLTCVKMSEEVWLTCLTHALSTETEEIMGLLLGDIEVRSFLPILQFFIFLFGLCCAQSSNCLVGLEFVWLGLFSEMGFWNSSHVLDSVWDNVELDCWVFAEFVNENCIFRCLAGKNCIEKKKRELFLIYLRTWL